MPKHSEVFSISLRPFFWPVEFFSSSDVLIPVRILVRKRRKKEESLPAAAAAAISPFMSSVCFCRPHPTRVS